MGILERWRRYFDILLNKETTYEKGEIEKLKVPIESVT